MIFCMPFPATINERGFLSVLGTLVAVRLKTASESAVPFLEGGNTTKRRGKISRLTAAYL